MLLFSASFALGAMAQDAGKGKDILNKTSARYKSFSSIKADFKYTLKMQAQNFQEQQKGTLYLKKDKFKIDLGEQMIMTDGKSVWTYLKSDNEVTVDKYNPKDMPVNPSDIFTSYDKGFNYAYMGDQVFNGKQVSLVELTPTNKSESFFKVKLYIDKANYSIHKSEIFEKNGNIYTYEITGLEPNVNMADNFFSFEKSKFPGVQVVDLR